MKKPMTAYIKVSNADIKTYRQVTTVIKRRFLKL